MEGVRRTHGDHVDIRLRQDTQIAIHPGNAVLRGDARRQVVIDVARGHDGCAWMLVIVLEVPAAVGTQADDSDADSVGHPLYLLSPPHEYTLGGTSPMRCGSS